MKKRVLALFLIISIILSMFPSMAFGSEFFDMPDNWSTAALENAVENGLLRGNNGKIMPDEDLTRAQMAAIINRAFGSSEKASISKFTDVYTKSWYYDDIAKSVYMKTFIGNGDKFYPDNKITREEAFTALARAFKLSGSNNGVLDKFTDNNLLSDWALDGVSSLVSEGYVAGSNGLLNPKQFITRGEFAQIMDNLLKGYINAAGTYTTDYTGNVMVNVPDVTLKNLTITGDLVIGDGVGNGTVTLDGVTVTGRTIVRGGGKNSIRIIGNSNIQNIIIARVNGVVRVYVEDGTEIGEVIVDGSDDIIIKGTVGMVTVLAFNVTVTATDATIESALVIGDNSKVIVDKTSTINKITVSGQGTSIDGNGTVKNVQVDNDNVTVNTPNTEVTASTGTTGVTAGGTTVQPGTTEKVKVESHATGSGGRVNNNYVSSIAITSAGNVMTVVNGNTLQMSAFATPDNATNKTVTWSVIPVTGSAIIDANGLLTATGVGTVTVTATSTDGSAVTGTFNLNIVPITINYFDEKTNEIIHSNVEYSIDNGITWVVGPDTVLDLFPGQDVDFRITTTSGISARQIQTLEVPERPLAPKYQINFVDEQIDDFSAYDEYSLDGFISPGISHMSGDLSLTGDIAPNASGEDTKILWIKTSATNHTFESEVQALSIPAIPERNAFSYAVGSSDYLVGLPASATDLEARISSDGNSWRKWIDITVESDGKASLIHDGGDLIQIRSKVVTGAAFAGEIVQQYSKKCVSELSIGDLVIDNSWQWEHKTGVGYTGVGAIKPITWTVVAKNHYGASSGVTLLSNDLIGQFIFDNRTEVHWGGVNLWGFSNHIRPWLNGSGIYTGNGFYDAFSDEFRSSILITDIPNEGYNAGKYTTQDKVFIPSTIELGDSVVSYEYYDEIMKETRTRYVTFTIGTVYPFFDGATNSDRIAKLGASNFSYWTRSPESWLEDIVHCFLIDGSQGIYMRSDNKQAKDNNGVRPALNINPNMLVSGIPNESGIYEIFYAN